MSLTKVSYSMINGAPVNVLDYGAVGDGITNDTVAIQAAIDAVYAAGGGTIDFPSGTYLVSNIALNWGTSPISIVFAGAGQDATVIKKTGSAGNLVSFSATLGDGTYSEIRDITFDGDSIATNGLDLTMLARNTFKNVKVTKCTNFGVYAYGSLINTFYDCNFTSNAYGYVCRANGSIRTNLVQFFGGSIRGNTAQGFDIGDTSGLNIYGTDFEQNGTSGGTGGAIVIRSTCGTEFGSANITINGAWFEANYGTALSTENATNLYLTIKDTPFIASESGKAITVGVIAQVLLEGVIAQGSSDTAALSASLSIIRGSSIHTLTDSSSAHTYENVTTSAGSIQFEQKTSSGTFDVNNNAVRSGSGSVSTSTGSATTIFSTSGNAGMFIVYAIVASAGSSYMSNARMGWDGTNLTRMGGENGANLSITASGSNVQVTQISGVSQTIYYWFLRVGS